MGRYCHDRAGAVFHQDKIGDIDRNLFAVEGIEAVSAGKDALFLRFLFSCSCAAFPVMICATKSRTSCFLVRAGDERCRAADARRQCDMKVTPKMVSGRVVKMEIFSSLPSTGKSQVRPVDLPIQLRCMVTTFSGQPCSLSRSAQQFFGIIGDLEKPAVHLPRHDRLIAAPAGAVDDLFIGQDGLAGFAPVDGGHLLVDDALFLHLEKEQLFPAVICGVAGGDLPLPVIGKAELAQLVAHVIDVVIGPAWPDGCCFSGRHFPPADRRRPSPSGAGH